MNLVKRIIVNVLHPVIDDCSSQDVANVSKSIKHLDHVTSTRSLSVLLDLFFEEFDPQLNHVLGPKSWCIEFRDFKGFIEFEQGGYDWVHAFPSSHPAFEHCRRAYFPS